ncbi:hypothetical protein CAPTEDRAFT_219862 [Capitella teleta]|uniref:Peptidase S9 prolyl oligopeptidase catalytic domain-containing protein n=1 Tax=Capitella teleta TaxID=283909 RepID=R7TSK1_CAPTE|nr:hypothetical protein CAPTEDRAFT_219862 [Capitella teleta]|eukprot:ELT96587.1 hypothetical protein CAPTEDRAFT_219862 [Capitella teleta]
MAPTIAEYGTWASPISSSLATESSVSYQELLLDYGAEKQDVVYWSEARCNEGGRYVICSLKVGDSKPTEWTPENFNARTLVHEYGGGSFLVHKEVVYFSNFKDQRLYRQTSADAQPEPVTPDGKGLRFADGEFSEKVLQIRHQKIYIVQEDHSVIGKNDVKEPRNTVIVIDPITQEIKELASGADFYSSPRVSPNGKRIVWMQWTHPNMPWDSTEIWEAELTDSGDGIKDGSLKCVVKVENVSVMMPRWTPQNELLYIGDQSDWWNVYHVTADGDHLNLCLREEELGGPHWQFGNSMYSVNPSGTGKIATSFAGKLGLLNTKKYNYTQVETGFSQHHHLAFNSDDWVFCIAGSPARFPVILRCHLPSKQVEVLATSQALSINQSYISIPQFISWPTTEGQKSYGYYYPPQNLDYQGPLESRPPLLVKAHGGPTSATSNSLNLGIQYFTSRGFGVLDVNYRGSTGYGKNYRHLLRSKWGLLDVADCCSGAQYLVETGKADRRRLCIDGGSAGGYTTLACLCFHDVFNAGVSKYGIGDLAILVAETHKFESRYCDRLLAPCTPENQHIFDSRSPMKHIDQFNCPIAFFQGDEDKIVPPNQAEMMFNAIKEKKIPCAMVIFKGEQHGFRKAENIQMALDGEFYFYSRIFGFKPANLDCQLPIENM